jgi:hypothetical protein
LKPPRGALESHLSDQNFLITISRYFCSFFCSDLFLHQINHAINKHKSTLTISISISPTINNNKMHHPAIIAVRLKAT